MSAAFFALVVLFAAYHAWRWRQVAGQAAPRAGEPVPTPAAAGRVSFLVAAWNAAADIPAFVAAFRALSYANRELVLCAGGGDGSFEVARRLSGEDVTVVEQLPGEGKQRALRKALPLAKGDVIYLTDVDCRPDDAAVDPLLAAVVGGAEAVTGSIRPLPEEAGNAFVVAQWGIERFNTRTTGATSSGLRGANAALRRDALEGAGGFDVEASSGTDYTLARELTRAGYGIAFAAGSEMPTRYPGTVGSYIRKQARWLRNVVLIGRRYGRWAEVRSVATTLAFPCVVVALALAGGWFWPWGGLAVLLLLHALFNRLRFLSMGGLPPRFAGVVQTLAGDLAAGLLATAEVFRGRMTWS